MTMRLVERSFGTAPNPLHWYVQCISLDTYSAKFVGFFWCVKESCIPSLVAKKYKYLLCFYQVAFERSHPHLSQTFVYRSAPPQSLTNAPYNLFRKLLFSQFHTEPHSGQELFQKSFILYYNIRKKCNISQAFFSFILVEERLRLELNK